MASVAMLKAERSALIEDLQETAHSNKGQRMTRDFYRSHGAFSEKIWHRHFAGFKDFLEAAGIDTAPEQPAEPETNEFKDQGNTWNVSLPKTRIHTLDELLDYCEVDRALWVVDSFVVNKYEIGAKNADKKIVVEPLFQVKATLRKRPEIAAARDEIAKLKEAAKAVARFPEPIYNQITLTGNVLEINVPDLHAGKLSWSKETGYGNYDTKIALEVFRTALDALINRVSHFRFERIVFVTGNDLLHSDDAEGRTTSGTYVGMDGRYHKTFVAVRDMLIEAVERLRRIAPVTIISCPGNHDALAAWHVADSLECYFHNYSDVTVDNSPKARKYYQFGKVMLMFTHGNTGKRADYALTMAAEEPGMWGATKFREAHTGHLHQTKTEEFHGVRVRILPALCETDAWHAAHAFTNHLRVAEAYVWNKDEGLVAQAFYGAD